MTTNPYMILLFQGTDGQPLHGPALLAFITQTLFRRPLGCRKQQRQLLLLGGYDGESSSPNPDVGTRRGRLQPQRATRLPPQQRPQPTSLPGAAFHCTSRHPQSAVASERVLVAVSDAQRITTRVIRPTHHAQTPADPSPVFYSEFFWFPLPHVHQYFLRFKITQSDVSVDDAPQVQSVRLVLVEAYWIVRESSLQTSAMILGTFGVRPECNQRVS